MNSARRYALLSAAPRPKPSERSEQKEAHRIRGHRSIAGIGVERFHESRCHAEQRRTRDDLRRQQNGIFCRIAPSRRFGNSRSLRMIGSLRSSHERRRARDRQQMEHKRCALDRDQRNDEPYERADGRPDEHLGNRYLRRCLPELPAPRCKKQGAWQADQCAFNGKPVGRGRSEEQGNERPEHAHNRIHEQHRTRQQRIAGLRRHEPEYRKAHDHEQQRAEHDELLFIEVAGKNARAQHGGQHGHRRHRHRLIEHKLGRIGIRHRNTCQQGRYEGRLHHSVIAAEQQRELGTHFRFPAFAPL